jgi:hypothetical protein
VQVTAVVPTGKKEPEGGLHIGSDVPPIASTVKLPPGLVIVAIVTPSETIKNSRGVVRKPSTVILI